MPFKVSARTILQLGGELISSDGIAFYELIKNSFDAGAKRATVEIVVRLSIEVWAKAINQLDDWWNEGCLEEQLESLKISLAKATIPSRVSDTWLNQLDDATTIEDVRSTTWDANYIRFHDTGEGMTMEELNEVYLTIGTPKRLNQRIAARKAKRRDVILGEKGIGRLSAMRLGSHLSVETATSSDHHWNELHIDWNVFSEIPGQLVEDVAVAPIQGGKKIEESGTSITIRGLSSNWSEQRLQQIANTDLSRFTDPFANKRAFPITVKWNGNVIPVPRMSDLIEEHAHATVQAEFYYETDSNDQWQPYLKGKVEYLVSGTTNAPIDGYSHSFSCQTDEIISTVLKAPEFQDVSFEDVLSLGPVTMQCYWFNRRLLKTIEVNDEKLNLRDLISQWSGGLMVYRDGFRVPPYGGADDDWLNLDRKALASQAYKVNRAQIIGKVDISSIDNPKLIDQTNREGLRDCPEKLVLVALMKHVLETEFRAYIVEVDNELREKERISFGSLSDQLAHAEDKIELSLTSLDEANEAFPDYGLGKIENDLRSAFKTVVGVVNTMQQNVEDIEGERERILFLASLGLSIEKLAHELNRATRHALDAIKSNNGHTNSADQPRTATLQLTSLQKRLQNLDPMLSPTRQRKSKFDMFAELESIVAGHEAQFKRHGIQCSIKLLGQAPVEVKLVRAMIVQIMENLIDNSIYWLSVFQSKPEGTKRKPEIRITINERKGWISIWDSGPGVAKENADRIFRAFYTKKPAGKGKGLGLYISREIAEYHGGELTLSLEDSTSPGRLNTFIFNYARAQTSDD